MSFWFTEEICCMMHAFGDHAHPMRESARLIETLVQNQLIVLLDKAYRVAYTIRQSSIIGAEDLLFLMRKDCAKLTRLINHLYVKDIRSSLPTTTVTNSQSSPMVVMQHQQQSNQQQNKRVRLCYDFMSQLDEFGEYKKVFNQAIFDEIKNQRMRRIDQLTKNMTQAEYIYYTKARQVSFSSVHSRPNKFNDWILMSFFQQQRDGNLNKNTPQCQINLLAMEILQYLAHEIVAQIVDLALLVRQDMEREEGDPISVLISRSHYNLTRDNISLNPISSTSNLINQNQNKMTNLQLSSDNKITPTHIHEAIRRYRQFIGPFSEIQAKNLDCALAVMCI